MGLERKRGRDSKEDMKLETRFLNREMAEVDPRMNAENIKNIRKEVGVS